jgi:hypothetical protein
MLGLEMSCMGEHLHLVETIGNIMRASRALPCRVTLVSHRDEKDISLAEFAFGRSFEVSEGEGHEKFSRIGSFCKAFCGFKRGK